MKCPKSDRWRNTAHVLDGFLAGISKAWAFPSLFSWSPGWLVRGSRRKPRLPAGLLSSVDRPKFAHERKGGGLVWFSEVLDLVPNAALYVPSEASQVRLLLLADRCVALHATILSLTSSRPFHA